MGPSTRSGAAGKGVRATLITVTHCGACGPASSSTSNASARIPPSPGRCPTKLTSIVLGCLPPSECICSAPPDGAARSSPLGAALGSSVTGGEAVLGGRAMGGAGASEGAIGAAAGSAAAGGGAGGGAVGGDAPPCSCSSRRRTCRAAAVLAAWGDIARYGEI